MNEAVYKLKFELSDGKTSETEEVQFAVPVGEDGISITGATVDDRGHLILTLSKGEPIDAGEVKGSQGDKGAVYTPSVSSDGVISWTNNGNLSNPTPVNIKGKDGDPGVSVTGATIEDNGHLIVTLSKGDPIDAGYAKGDAPEVSIEQIDSGHRVTIGNETFDVMDGNRGLLNVIDGESTGSVKSIYAADDSIGDYAFALGKDAIASGPSSFAEGSGTIAEGRRSHAEGEGTAAYGRAQHAQGKYNIIDDDDVYAHIVGNGSSSNRSNAHTLDWDGNAWFAGKVYVGGTGMRDPNKKELGTGGGASSWNDLTDKPFEENHAGEGYLIPPTQLSFRPASSSFNAYTPLKSPVVGNRTYTISYNGIEYECAAIDVTEMIGMPMCLLGNYGYMLGGDDTGEPFIIMVSDDETAIAEMLEGTYLVLVPLDGASGVRLSIYGEGTFVKPIDPKFLPNGLDETVWTAMRNAVIETCSEGFGHYSLARGNFASDYVNNAETAKLIRACARVTLRNTQTGEKHILDKHVFGSIVMFGNPALLDSKYPNTGEDILLVGSIRENSTAVILKNAADDYIAYELEQIHNETNKLPVGFAQTSMVSIPTLDGMGHAHMLWSEISKQLLIYESDGTMHKVQTELVSN